MSDAGRGPEPFILFGAGDEPEYQSGAKLFDPRSSDGMTRIAIRDFFLGRLKKTRK
jgi:hypothetical protein